jgi:two-component system chemotaxis response regulator CheB
VKYAGSKVKKVLVVDDSALMRKLLGTVLTEAGYEVHSARNGAEGVQQLLELQPHVVTLDINMPEMDGLTALSLMMAARPTPVVMVSSLTEQGALATLEALALGAVDFVAKPGGTISMSIESVRDELLSKVAAASTACLSRPAQRIAASAPAAPCAYRERPRLAPMSGAGLVLIGVSTGGPRTLEEILPALPSGFAWPVLVAQHMPPNFTDAFARRLNSLCALEVVEVDKPMPLKAGHVYGPPAGQHRRPPTARGAGHSLASIGRGAGRDCHAALRAATAHRRDADRHGARRRAGDGSLEESRRPDHRRVGRNCGGVRHAQ